MYKHFFLENVLYTINTVKRQPQNGIFANHVTDKRLIFIMYDEPLQLNKNSKKPD